MRSFFYYRPPHHNRASTTNQVIMFFPLSFHFLFELRRADVKQCRCHLCLNLSTEPRSSQKPANYSLVPVLLASFCRGGQNIRVTPSQGNGVIHSHLMCFARFHVSPPFIARTKHQAATMQRYSHTCSTYLLIAPAPRDVSK